DVARFAAADLVERFGVATAGGQSAAAALRDAIVARDGQRAVVLLLAADVKRRVLRRNHVIELLGRKALPGPADRTDADVVGNRAAAVIANHDVLRIGGGDPQIAELG